ncbi:RND transporter [Oceanospirillum linum]|uniref:RND transporter n=1 Tax=Oceanospirillum linum TaxID=966 RepID=A0A1T1HDQ6_OCELI|nr:RND transporter [Oceanospirillum linum]
MNWIDALPWSLLIIGSLTLGLAPFFPEPHLIEKLRMLGNGELKAPLDWFDLFMHGAPPFLLIVKLAATGLRQVA